ncbi:unnamed protein product, partial [Candidula unifasciata]
NLARTGISSYGSTVIVDENDATCNYDQNFQSMTTKWATAHHFSWLRLRFSQSGRNVAISQNTFQSSTYTDSTYEERYSLSSNAVDGNPSGNFGDLTCAHTKTELKPSWDLTLETSKLVHRYVVYNRG